MSGQDIIKFAAWRQSYLDLGGKENAKADPVHCTGVKRLSSFYEFLLYWEVCITALVIKNGNQFMVYFIVGL